MAIHHSTYLEIPPDRRQAAAGHLEQSLREQLADPDLSDERRAKLLAKVERLSKWIAGTAEVVDVKMYHPDGTLRDTPPDDELGGGRGKPRKAPKANHEVEVTEEVVVIEGD